MKLLLVFALLALVCMARSAPASSPSRQLVLQQYDEAEDTPHDDIKVTDEDEGEEDEDDEETTTTTSTTRRTTGAFPTRNRNLIPSRRSSQTQPITTTTRRTQIIITGDDDGEGDNEYDGDYKYIRNFRKYFQQLMEDIKKLVRGLTGLDLGATIINSRQQYPAHEE